MDKQLIATRFAKARTTYSRAAQAQRKVAERMMELLADALPSTRAVPLHAVEIGCGTGIYTRLLAEKLHPAHLLLNDLCPEMEPYVSEVLHPFRSTTKAQFVAGDAEYLTLPAASSLITSCSTLQWFNDPAAFFRRCHETLAEEGLLAFSTFGSDNLCEIRTLTGHGLTYPPMEVLKRMLIPEFDILHAEEERVTLWFDSPEAVLRHLKKTGVTGTEKRIWTRSRLYDFCTAYRTRYGEAGKGVPLTYHPYYLVAKKRIINT